MCLVYTNQTPIAYTLRYRSSQCGSQFSHSSALLTDSKYLDTLYYLTKKIFSIFSSPVENDTLVLGTATGYFSFSGTSNSDEMK